MPLGLLAQLSPGDLSKAHEHLEGLSNCTKCHVLGEKVTNENCLNCHKEIKDLLALKRGYHASVEVAGKDCFSCHSEHHGKNFQLTRFDLDQFNHQLAGYVLEGKHSQINCKDCHKVEFIRSKTTQKKERTFLGLGTECLSCHEDYHRQTISSNCASCHGFQSFSPAVKFDHQSSRYPLTGRHKVVSCDKCHRLEQREGKKFQQFAGLIFDNCAACHADVHHNKFGKECQKCHSEESFYQVTNLTGFDHNQTNFSLQGKHLRVDCKSCHKQSYVKPVAHSRCADCHSDYHKGQFTQNKKSSDCADCHNVNGFSFSSYTIEQHNQTDFQLAGAHLATPCFLCHQKQDRWEFRKVGEGCVDCHENIHQGHIPEKFMPDQQCNNCHAVSNWCEVKFDHHQTGFDLVGKHAETTCRSCHFRQTNTMGFIQHFTDLNSRCETCHKDVHQEQFRENGQTLCERCHGFDNWKANRFSHDKTRFKLEGAHIKVDCEKCHKPITEPQGKYIRYKLFKEIKCANCHS